MGWVTGQVFIENFSQRQSLFKADIVLGKRDEIVFHGAVLGPDGRAKMSGAMVMAFAHTREGRELPLGHTYSGDDGYYILPVEKRLIPAAVSAITVRTGD